MKERNKLIGIKIFIGVVIVSLVILISLALFDLRKWAEVQKDNHFIGDCSEEYKNGFNVGFYQGYSLGKNSINTTCWFYERENPDVTNSDCYKILDGNWSWYRYDHSNNWVFVSKGET